MAAWKVSTSLSTTGFLFAVSGINFCVKSAQRQTCLSAAEGSNNHVDSLFDLFDNLII
jgi:hypothetical protein